MMPAPGLDLSTYLNQVTRSNILPWTGEIVEVVGLLLASRGPAAAVGDFCEVLASSGRRIRTQVIGFRNGNVLSMPLEEVDGIQLHDTIVARQGDSAVSVGPELIGRVVDGFGELIDRKPRIRTEAQYPLYKAAESPMDREHITQSLSTGIRAIDT